MCTNKLRPHAVRRAAATTVEMAFVVPVVLLVLFASLEFGRANMIQHTAENAAYEGARHGIVPGASVAECKAAAQQILDAVGIRNATIDVTPDPITNGSDEVQVDVTVPMDSNGFVAVKFLGGKSLAASCLLSREVTGLTLDE